MSLRHLAPLLALVLALAPLRARAQDDDDGFGDDDSSATTAHHRHHRDSDDDDDDQLEEEPDPYARNMARMDDPRIGLGAELAISLALLDNSKGPGVTGTAGFGFRLNWAPGFLWTDPEDAFWREALLIEFSYDYAGYSGGTTAVNMATKLNYLNWHVMFGWPIRDVLLLYGAVGPGFTVEKADSVTEDVDVPLTGIKFNLAYGLGARLNLQLNRYFALVSRIELMRYRRGDRNDTFLTFSLGGAF